MDDLFESRHELEEAQILSDGDYPFKEWFEEWLTDCKEFNS